MLTSVLKSSPVSGPIARSAEQFESALRHHTIEHESRARLDGAISVIDSTLSLLEWHNVKGTVPDPLVVELGVTEVVQATAQFGMTLSRGGSLRKLMDGLFDVQQRLMAKRAGREWDSAYTDDDREPSEPVTPPSAA